MPKNSVPAFALSQDDEDFLVSLNDKRLGSAIRANSLASQEYSEARIKRKSLADAMKLASLDQGNYTPTQRKRLLEIAEKIETSIPIRPMFQPSVRAQKRADQRTQRERLAQAGSGAEQQLRFMGYPGSGSGKNFVTPREREKFERFLGNRPPSPKASAPAPTPSPAPKEEKKEPTTREKIVTVAQRRAAQRQMAKSVKPAPRRHVKLHVKKSALPKLSKGRNVKLQVPSSDLPQTGRLRNILNKGR